MKIIQVINSLSAGGAEILAKDLSLELKRYGFDIEIWSIGKSKNLNFEKQFINELNKNKIKLVNYNKIPNRERIKTSLRILSNILKEKPDLIHVHGEAIMFHMLIPILVRRVCIVETIHNTVIEYPKLHKYIYRKIVNHFVAISKKVSNILSEQVNIDHNKITQIYNGIKIEKYITKRKEESNIMRIINIGRLTKQKDQATLIQAIKILRNKYFSGSEFPIILNIFGEGELKQTLKTQIRYSNLENHVFLREVDYDIPKIFSEHDLFVMSSRWEGFPLVILEAMASKIPIISTNVGSLSEMLEHGVHGILLPPADAEKLADSIFFLFKEKELRSYLSENAFRRVCSLFNIETCASFHVDMYNRLIR